MDNFYFRSSQKITAIFLILFAILKTIFPELIEIYRFLPIYHLGFSNPFYFILFLLVQIIGYVAIIIFGFYLLQIFIERKIYTKFRKMILAKGKNIYQSFLVIFVVWFIFFMAGQFVIVKDITIEEYLLSLRENVFFKIIYIVIFITIYKIAYIFFSSRNHLTS
jgi:hypothetical protein